jgi:hypothetical protein
VLTHTIRGFLERNHRKISKKQQNFDYRGTRPAPSNRLGGWKNKHNRARRSHDDRRNLDAAISGIHDKQNTTRRHGRSKEDNTTIQGFCHVTRKIIQEKYNMHLATMHHSSRRARNLKGYPCRSMWTSC